MNRLFDYVPVIQQKSSVFKEIAEAVNEEIKPLYDIIRDLEKQLNIDTATWGLAIYESELKLPVRPNKTLEERRAIVKAKWRGLGKIDYLMIKAVAEAFTNSTVVVSFDGTIEIIFPNGSGIRFTDELIKAIDEIKPAHLSFRYEVHKGNLIKIKSYVQRGLSDLPLCNTIESGTWWYQQNLGRIKQSTIAVDTITNSHLFDYPETALTVSSLEKLYQYYEFATQLTLEQVVTLNKVLKSVHYDYIKANEILSGEYPEILNKIKSINKGIELGSEVRLNITEYPVAGDTLAKESE